MGNVGAGFSMSLDGFIARPNGDEGPLFDWYFAGDTKIQYAGEDRGIQTSAESAEHIEQLGHAVGAIVSGRGMFDTAKAWGGRHPMDVPVFVVTHNPPQEWVYEGSPFTFVTDGVESAVAQAKKVAGDKTVGVGGANVAQQCLRAGLLDEIGIDLVPVILDEGIRFLENLGGQEIELESTGVNPAPGVTHLSFRVVKKLDK